MPRAKLVADMNRLGRAVRVVRATSQAESEAITQALPRPTDETLARLHASHLAELDAIQQLLTTMELIERLHPELFAVTTRVVS